MELNAHQATVQLQWNRKMDQNLSTSSALEYEDYHALCVGFCIGNGCTPETAQQVASHPDTVL